MENLTLVKIPNPFVRHDRDISMCAWKGESLAEIMAMEFPSGPDLVVSVNGILIPNGELEESYPRPGDWILFIPQLQGGGDDDKGKVVLRSVLMIAVMIVSFIVAPYLAAALAPMLGVAASGMAALTSFVAMGLATIGGIIIKALTPPPSPPELQPSTLDAPDFRRSVAYSWSPHTTQQQGLVVPKWYGRVKLYGNIIAAHVENRQENKQYLKLLIAVGMGPIYRLSHFMINDQPVGRLAGVRVETRNGNLYQNALPGFNDTKIEYPLSVHIQNGSPYTYTTVGSAFDRLEVDITFPRGLWHLNNQGNMEAISARLRIRCKPVTGGDWVKITENVVQTKRATKVEYWSYGYWITYGLGTQKIWHETRQGTTDEDDHFEGETEGRGSYAYWRWLDGTHYEIATETVAYEDIRKKSTSLFRLTYVSPRLDRGKWLVEVSRLDDESTGTRYGDGMYLTNVREILEDDFNYPRTALVSIRALATGQLSGSLRFSCIGMMSLVRVYRSNNWYVEYSDNPAWVAWDILTQPVFSNTKTVLRYDGINPSRLDLTSFKDWAGYCNQLVSDGKGGQEKRCLFAGGFDAATSVWDALMEVCRTGRAILIWNGVKLSAVVDKPSTPVQLFTVGNIAEDNFKVAYLALNERASEVEIDFVDKDKDYQREKIRIFDPDAADSTYRVNLDLRGVTRRSEAWRIGMLSLYNNKYLRRIIELTADIDAIACTIGDRIYVQHDVPIWATGGRIVSATSGSVTLDQTVNIETGKSYAIVLRISGDDSIVERAVTNSPGETDTLTVSTPFSTVPERFDVFAFGESEKVVKTFTVLELSRTADQRCTIVAIEYNVSVYNVDTDQPAIPLPDYTSAERVPAVTDLSLDELAIRGADGAIINVIDVSFRKPGSSWFSHVEIWTREGSADWQFIAPIYEERYRIVGLTVGLTYTVAARGVNTLGDKQTIQESPTSAIYVKGKEGPPSDVTGFVVKQSGNFVEFSWSHIEDVDLWGYEIRRGPTWHEGVVIAKLVSANRFSWRADFNGTFRFLIKAIDESGYESISAASADITLRGVDEKINAVLEVDEIGKPGGPDGTKDNLTFADTGVGSSEAPFLAIPFGLVDTDVPGMTDQHAEITGYAGDRDLMASYETLTIDCLEIGNINIRIATDADAWDRGATDQSYPSRLDQAYPEDTDQHVSMPSGTLIYYSISEDDVDWSGWQLYSGTVQERFRYIKFKIEISIASTSGAYFLQALNIILDVPDVVFVIDGLSISASTGTDITYSSYTDHLFFSVPIVIVTLLDATAIAVPVVSSKTKTGCHINLIDKTDSKVSGTVDVRVSGF